MRAVIDRFEGKWAVLEAEGKMMWNVPRQFLPAKAAEGDVVEITFKIAAERTNKNSSLVEEIFD